jgi:hypothetical protein
MAVLVLFQEGLLGVMALGQYVCTIIRITTVCTIIRITTVCPAAAAAAAAAAAPPPLLLLLLLLLLILLLLTTPVAYRGKKLIPRLKVLKGGGTQQHQC